MVPMLYAAGGYPGIRACDDGAEAACSAWLHLHALLLHHVCWLVMVRARQRISGSCEGT